MSGQSLGCYITLIYQDCLIVHNEETHIIRFLVTTNLNFQTVGKPPKIKRCNIDKGLYRNKQVEQDLY